MRYLFHNWDGLKAGLADKYIFLFLDYDGTLTPIAEDPAKAIMKQETRKVLEELSMAPRCILSIISGRALDDLKNKIGLKDIIYSGNHGLEIEGPKITFENPVPLSYIETLGDIKGQLAKKLSSVKGYILEDKGLSLGLHYRLVDENMVAFVKTVFHEVTLPYKSADKIKISSGKMVLEVRPPVEWDKGKVVLWLLGREGFILKDEPILPVYIGDDKGDEDAFSALKEKGLTIFVGEPDVYSAEYYLKDTDEVMEFLKRILELKRKG